MEFEEEQPLKQAKLTPHNLEQMAAAPKPQAKDAKSQ